MNFRQFVILAALLTPAVASAQAPPSWAEFTRSFQAYADSDQVVGASVVLMKNGRAIAHYNTGFANRDKRQAVDSQTIFHWGSITKSLTAIGIMQLRDRGKLSLDDKIVRWVPELRTMHDPFGMMDSITIRMLLAHTAGFQGGTWPYGDNQPWEPFEPTTWNQLVAMMPYQRLLYRPGSRYSYSNPAFVYLARVIEQITGDPWDTYIQKNIFAPLDLSRSYFRTTPYYLAAHRSHNYDVVRDSTRGSRLVDNGPDFDPGITSPNGAWNAPLGDLVKYTAFLTNALLPGMTRERYDVVLSRKSLEEMWQRGLPMAAGYQSTPQQWMGLSFFIRERNGQRILGHTGSQAGFRAFFYFDPSNGIAIIAAFNTTNSATPATALQRLMQEAAFDLLRQ